MNENLLKAVGAFALLSSAVVTLTAMFRAADGILSPTMILFALWAVSPYVVLFAAMLLLTRFTALARIPLVFGVIAVLMLFAAVWTYVLAYSSESSTYGLVFLFMPLWMHIGGFLMFGGGVLWSWLSGTAARRAN